MSDTTAQLALPAPGDLDPADVPEYIDQLRDRLEAILSDNATGHVWSTGDFKHSAQTGDHGRWLLCDGRELSAAQVVSALSLPSGKADGLAGLLGTGGSSKYGSASSGKMRLPDARGRTLLAAGAGSGLTSRAIADTGGVESVTLTGAQSGLKSHGHALTDPGHSHAVTDPGHNHGASQSVHAHAFFGSSDEHPGHSHGLSQVNNVRGSSSGTVTNGGGSSVNTATAGAHTHAVSGLTDNQQPSVTVSSQTTGVEVSSHATGVTLADAGVADAAQAHTNMPPYLAAGNLFIRV